MKTPVITFDVSKGNAHYQGFIDLETSFSKTKLLRFTKNSFKELSEYASSLREKTNKEVVYVFESTGIYHEVLKKYLNDNNLTYFIISPLLSSKYRQTELHSNKTDPLDCRNIAKVYYGCDESSLNQYKSYTARYDKLVKLNRQYEDVIKHLRKYKVSLRARLDIACPDYDSYFPNGDIYTSVSCEILKKWPHPDLILKTREETMIKYLKGKLDHNKPFIISYVSKIKKWASEIYPGCNCDDEIVKEISVFIKHVQDTENEADEILKEMIDLAKDEPLFRQLVSIVGIGENLASRILAELGDISRFENVNKLTSYAGLDPMIRQSGKHDGIHLSISKKGNKRLRSLLYLAVSFNIKQKKNDPINNFYQRKRQQEVPLKPQVAKIAACRKLLTIIFYMNKSGELYRYN